MIVRLKNFLCHSKLFSAAPISLLLLKNLPIVYPLVKVEGENLENHDQNNHHTRDIVPTLIKNVFSIEYGRCFIAHILEQSLQWRRKYLHNSPQTLKLGDNGQHSWVKIQHYTNKGCDRLHLIRSALCLELSDHLYDDGPKGIIDNNNPKRHTIDKHVWENAAWKCIMHIKVIIASWTGVLVHVIRISLRKIIVTTCIFCKI